MLDGAYEVPRMPVLQDPRMDVGTAQNAVRLTIRERRRPEDVPCALPHDPVNIGWSTIFPSLNG